MIFCYTVLLFPRHSESDITPLSPGKSCSECSEFLFRNIQKNISKETIVVTPNVSNISGRNCLRCNSSYPVTLKLCLLRLFFSNFSWLLLLYKAAQHEADEQWLFLSNIIIKEKLVMKEYYHQSALYRVKSHNQQGVSKNAMLRQLAPSADEIYQEGSSSVIVLKRTMKRAICISLFLSQSSLQ